MTTFAAERPTFFEGQYIGADDLDAIVNYLRATSARQNLGQHTWGIAAGLDIVAQAISATAFEYYLQPGVAIDGYGRIIVVTSPTRIEEDKFVGISSGNIDIWIRYEQSEFAAVKNGFKVCTAEDEYRRVNETFAIEVGSKSSILSRQSGVTVNETLINDAREALVTVDPDASLLCDASIPHQQLPVDDETAYWLIPLGMVKWSSSANSFLPMVDPTEEEALAAGSGSKTRDQVYEALMLSRTKRRLIGVVAESVYPADGVIRLRERKSPFDPAVENDVTCNERRINSRDLSYCEAQLRTKELIWLEGDTRVVGDLRLFGNRLEFKEEDGRDYIDRTVEGNLVSSSTPLIMQRSAAKNAKNGFDLQMMLGASADGRNRFTIGQATVSGSDLCDMSVSNSSQIIFQDNGRAGIGTVTPETNLRAPLTIRGLADQIIENEGTDDETKLDVMRVLNIEGQAGNLAWQMDLWSDLKSLSFNESSVDNARLFLQAGGNVGIGIAEPLAKLDIQKVQASPGGSNLGDDIWLRVGDGGDAGRVWLEYGPQGAPLMVLSDDDDPPRIQFQQTASTSPNDDAAPTHSSWLGHARGLSPDMALMGGRLGIGTQFADAPLTVIGNGSPARFYSGVNGGHTWLGFYTDGNPGSARAGWLGYGSDGASDFTIHNEKANGDIVLLPNRNVGIGTNSPNDKLDVRGDIRLGGAGDLFAMGGIQNLRCVIGRVSAAGLLTQGAGFTPIRVSTGEFQIVFNQAFASTPIVLVTLVNNQDDVVSVGTISNNACVVSIRDIRNRDEDILDNSVTQVTNSEFHLVAFGER